MAPTSRSAHIVDTPNLTLSAAQTATEACMRRADEIGVPMNIAIVDSSLHLLSFARMPGAKLTSIDIAQSKAFTAAGHRAPTSVYKEAVWPGGKAFGINHSNEGKFTTIAGGYPMMLDDGSVVGAIGCSTGAPDQDEAVARAGVEALRELLARDGVKRKAKL